MRDDQALTDATGTSFGNQQPVGTAPLIQECICATSVVDKLGRATKVSRGIEATSLRFLGLRRETVEVLVFDLGVDRHEDSVGQRAAVFGHGFWCDAAFHEMAEHLIDGVPLLELFQLVPAEGDIVAGPIPCVRARLALIALLLGDPDLVFRDLGERDDLLDIDEDLAIEAIGLQAHAADVDVTFD